MKLLLLPPVNLILAAALLVLVARVWRLRLRWAWVALAAAAYILCTPITADRLLAWHQTYPPLQTRDLAQSDAQAIVVLSAGYQSPAAAFGQPALDVRSMTRLLYAAELARETGLPILVTGGRIGAYPRPIAQTMARFLRRWSQAEVAWIEPRAQDTWENAAYSTRMLEKAGIDRAYLVTHAWHMPRSVQAFRRHGLDVVPAPTGFTDPSGLALSEILPSAPGLQAGYFAMHEALGRIAYRLFRSVPAGSDQ